MALNDVVREFFHCTIIYHRKRLICRMFLLDESLYQVAMAQRRDCKSQSDGNLTHILFQQMAESTTKSAITKDNYGRPME